MFYTCLFQCFVQYFSVCVCLWWMKNRPLSRIGMFRRHGCAIATLIHYTVELFAFFPSGKSSSLAKSKYFQAQIRTSLCQQTPQWKIYPNNFSLMSHPNNATQIPFIYSNSSFGRHGAFLCTQTTQHINNICYGVVLHFSSRQYCTHASGSKTQNGRSHWIERERESERQKNTISRTAFINMIEIWMQFFPNGIPFGTLFAANYTRILYLYECAGTVVPLHLFTSIYRSFQMFELCLF